MTVAGGVSERLRQLASTLTGAGLPCEVTDDVWAAIWERLAFNAALNSLTALTRLTVGRLGATPDGRQLAEAVAEEVISVARRKGIAADLASVHATLAMWRSPPWRSYRSPL